MNLTSKRRLKIENENFTDKALVNEALCLFFDGGLSSRGIQMVNVSAKKLKQLRRRCTTET